MMCYSITKSCYTSVMVAHAWLNILGPVLALAGGADGAMGHPSSSLFMGWLLGLLLGTKHALDPDHIAAISTIVAERPRSRGTALLGAFWGAGHTVTLLGVGGALVALRSELPGWLTELFELCVAVMLLVLGVRGVRRALKSGSVGPDEPHNHGELRHQHRGAADHIHVGRHTFARRSFVVGLVHGLAGSGALTALALAGMPTVASSAIYIAFFGLGSIAGMALLTGLAGLSLSRVVRSPRGRARLMLVSSAASVILGIVWGSPMVLRLFGASNG